MCRRPIQNPPSTTVTITIKARDAPIPIPILVFVESTAGVVFFPVEDNLVVLSASPAVEVADPAVTADENAEVVVEADVPFSKVFGDEV